VGERPCQKIAIVTDEVQGHLWIESDEKTPRPRKIELLYFTHPNRPRYLALIERWDTQEVVDDALFIFKPPEGAVKLEMVPREEAEPGDER
jgi:hypothetical protein